MTFLYQLKTALTATVIRLLLVGSRSQTLSPVLTNAGRAPRHASPDDSVSLFCLFHPSFLQLGAVPR